MQLKINLELPETFDSIILRLLAKEFLVKCYLIKNISWFINVRMVIEWRSSKEILLVILILRESLLGQI